MATYTSNYAWTKPGGNDQVDISVLNGNLDSQDAIMHKAFTNMAQAFSAASTYAVGDIVLYDNDLYKCHTAVTVAGAWTGSTNWQVYKLSEGGSGGLTLGETSSTAYRGDRGKTAYDHSQIFSGNPHGTTKSDVGLGNVPNVSTNDQTPTFSEASTRNNIASGEKLSVILGKIAKFFNDLKTVAFSGSYADLTNKPNADDILMSDGVTSVEDALGNYKVIKSIIADGVKTYQQIFNELYSYSDDGMILMISGARHYQLNKKQYFNVMENGDGVFKFNSIVLDANNSTYYRQPWGSTVSNYTNSVVTQGFEIKLIKYY